MARMIKKRAKTKLITKDFTQNNLYPSFVDNTARGLWIVDQRLFVDIALLSQVK